MKSTREKIPVDRSSSSPPKGLTYSVLSAVSYLGLRASGTEIRDFLSRKLEQELDAASVYVLLRRLEVRGLIEVRDDAEQPVRRRGRPRRFYEITASGQRALKAGSVLLAYPMSASSGDRYGKAKGIRAKTA